MKKLWYLIGIVCLLLAGCQAETAAPPADASAEAASAVSEPDGASQDADHTAEEPETASDTASSEEVPAASGEDAAAGPETPAADSGEAPAEQPAAPPDGGETAAPPAGQTPAEQTPDDAPASEPEPTAPDAEPAAAPPTPPEGTAPGIWETADGLYYVQEDGTCLAAGSVGYLTFGADGRYTSGDADLDAGIDGLIADVCPDVAADREGRLRQLYTYIRDNYRYLSMDHYEAGSTHWGNSAALTMLNQGKGNCYNFTALFTACARRLGYQAYNVAGHEYSPDNDHAWTMIDWPDGATYLFDVQLEYAYLYQYSNRRNLDMFKASGSDGIYNGFVYYFP